MARHQRPTKHLKKKKAQGSNASTTNPFDLQSNARQKHTVLGKRTKGATRNVAAARAAADTRRKNTLRQAFQTRNKVNVFKDRRFGEQDTELSLEDKMLMRFQEERKRKVRKTAAFNLNSDDEKEEEFLTHKGSKIEKYENLQQAPSDDEDEGGQLAKQVVHELHFGGGQGNPEANKYGPEVKRSHKEIMQEVIAKSKYYKAERQKEKNEQEDATETLDRDFDDIQGLLKMRPTRSSNPSEKDKEKGKPDEYDQITRSLAFEAKAKASERRLTEEEIAKIEYEKLQKLEKERLKRMKGDDEDDTQKKQFARTDDDLDVDYEIDSKYVNDGDDEDEEDDEDESEDAMEEDQVSQDEEETAAPTELLEVTQLSASKKSKHSSKKQLPYIFTCPKNVKDLVAIFDEHANSIDDRLTIIDRLRKAYNVKLHAANRALMHNLSESFVMYFSSLAVNYTEESAEELNRLAPVLYEVAQDVPETMGKIFREYISALQMQFPSEFPQWNELLVLRLACHLFSASDLRHNVISPIELYIGNCLSREVNEFNKASLGKLDRALFLVGLSLQITSTKARFCPETLVYLGFILQHFVPQLMKTKAKAKDTTEQLKLSIGNTAGAPNTNTLTFARQVVMSSLLLVEQCCQAYESIAALAELLAPIAQILRENLPTAQASSPLTIQLRRTFEMIEKSTDVNLKARRPLRLQAAAPKMIETLTPRFDENYTMRKDRDADRTKAQTKQLQRQVKRERKAAARELRLDASFLARERMEEQTKRDADKAAKQREIQAWVTEQAATFNQQVRKGGGLLKGGGSGKAKRARIN